MTASPFTAALKLYGKPDPYATPFDVQRAISDEATNPPHLQALDEVCLAIDRGEEQYVQVSLPPQEGKSERMCRAFVTWWLRRHLDHKLILASFEKEAAQRWGRQIRNDLTAHPELGIRIRRDSAAADRWDIDGHRGGLYCVGVAGAITGRPADGLIIDDPVKGRAFVESQAYRDSQENWWTSDASTRLTPKSFVIVVLTRWHEDDLAGRLQANPVPMPNGRPWKVINIPALAGPNDPLDREPGEALHSVQGKDRAFYENIRARVGPYVFDSLYQGQPTPTEGGLFKRDNLRFWTAIPDDPLGYALQLGVRTEKGQVIGGSGQKYWLRDCYVFATSDLAASTKTSADWTVVSVWALTVDGDLILLDRIRKRLEETEHFQAAEPMLARWKPDWVGVEDSGRSVNMVSGLTAGGYSVRPLKADADKVTRALAATAKVAQRKVFLPADAAWLDEFIGELATFPNGRHDDQVDTLAYAAREVQRGLTHTLPVGVPPRSADDHELSPERLEPVSDNRLQSMEF